MLNYLSKSKEKAKRNPGPKLEKRHVVSLLTGAEGLEPSLTYCERILNPARYRFRHTPHVLQVSIVGVMATKMLLFQ